MEKNIHNFKNSLESESSARKFDDGKEEPKKEADREKSESEGKEDAASNLDNFKREADRSRLEYARRHHEVDNAFSRLRGIFGKDLRTDPKELGKTDMAYDQYKRALNDLKNQALAEISNDPTFTPEKRREAMGNLIKFFSLDEKLELYNAHSQAKAEAFEKKFGKFPGWFAKKGSAFASWHRKQNWKLKMAGSVVLTATGLGMVNRVVSGVVTGVGVAGMMEARHRKKEKEKSEEKKKDILESLEHIEDPEEKIKSLRSYLEEEINGLDGDLKTEKRKALYRKAAGITAGILIGSGVVAHIAKEALDHLGLTEVLSRLSHNVAPSHTAPEVPSHNVAPEITGHDITPEIPHNIELDISKGSSFEGAIIRHLEETGVDHKEAGKLAHRMYLDYVAGHPDAATHNYGLIHPGAQLELDPEGNHIAGFHDSSELKISHPDIVPDHENLEIGSSLPMESVSPNPSQILEMKSAALSEKINERSQAALYEKSFNVLESVAVVSAGAYALHRLGLTKFIEKNINKRRSKKTGDGPVPAEKKPSEARPDKTSGPAKEEVEEKKSGVDAKESLRPYRKEAEEKKDTASEKKEKHSETDNLSFFTKRFDNLFERHEKIQEMERKYPGLEKEKIPKEKEEELRKIYGEIRKSENNIKLSKRAKKGIAEGIDKTERTIEDLEKIIKKENKELEKKRKSRDSIQKGLGNFGELFYLNEQCKLDLSEMLRFMLKLVEEKKRILKGAALDKFLSENPKNGIGKIYHHYSEILGEDIAKPSPDEDMASWSYRFLKEVFKSKEIVYNITKSAKLR